MFVALIRDGLRPSDLREAAYDPQGAGRRLARGINNTIVGDSVNAAQRFETLGKIVNPDANSIVLLSRGIVESLPTGFKLRDQGTHMVKGRHEAIRVYQLSHEA